jgi:hypothetical protein
MSQEKSRIAVGDRCIVNPDTGEVLMGIHVESDVQVEFLKQVVTVWNATLGIATEDLEAGAIGRLVAISREMLDVFDPQENPCVDPDDDPLEGLMYRLSKALSPFEKVSTSLSQPRRDEEAGEE